MEPNKLDLTNLQKYQGVVNPLEYRRHSHLYKQPSYDINQTPIIKDKLAINTPSTSNGITRIRNKINSLTQNQVIP